MTRKFLLGFALLVVALAFVYIRTRKPRSPIEVAFAGNREVIAYSTTALVRSPVTTLSFGDRVDILQRFQDQVQVRTRTGLTGWVSEHELLSADLWQKARDLALKAATMPVQARGHTKVLSNLRLEPGRDTQRLQQLVKGVSLDVLMRQPQAVPSAKAAAQQEESAAEPAVEKKEDWWLVRAYPGPAGGSALNAAPSNPPASGANPVANTALSGWLLGRFVDLDVPRPLPDYASSANMRIVGWYELNHVRGPDGKPKPQYLVVGAHGPEGQPCDFTMLRVFTWGAKRDRYETAFVESDACGKLPVEVTSGDAAPGVRNPPDAQFSFFDLGDASKRTYLMHQTVVRRVREPGSPKAKRTPHP